MGNVALRRRKLEFSNISRSFSAFFSGLLLVLLLASPCAAQTDCDWRDGVQCEQPVGADCDPATGLVGGRYYPDPAGEGTDWLFWMIALFLALVVLAFGVRIGQWSMPKPVSSKKAEARLAIADVFNAQREEALRHDNKPLIGLLHAAEAAVSARVMPLVH
jgi:hypothetical protein